MRKTTILVFFLMTAIGINGQNQLLIDSLSLQLQEAPDTEQVDIFNRLSRIYWQRSFDTSLLMAQHAVTLSERLEDQRRIALSTKYLGSAYAQLGDYSKGLEQYMAALDLFKVLEDSTQLGTMYNNLGVIYLRTGSYQQALEHFDRALEFEEKLGNIDMIAGITNNIGIVYYEREEYAKAFEYFQDSYRIRLGQGDRQKISVSLNNLGEVSNYLGRHQEALDYYRQSLEISTSLNDRNMIATAYANIGDIYCQTGQYGKSEKYLKDGLSLAREVNNNWIRQEIYEKLSELSEEQHQFGKALEYFKLYSQTKDSILSEETQAKIAELQVKYNAESFQDQIEQVQTENELNELLIKRMRWIVFFLIIICILVGVALYINDKRNRLKRETNRLLTEQNKKLEQANRQLQASELHLKELNTTKDKLFSIIGHDLRNPLNALMGFSELISGNNQDYSLEEMQKYTSIINESAKNIHQLIENLLDWSRSQTGNLDVQLKDIDLLKLTLEIVEIHKISASNKELSLETLIPENTVILADRNLLATILRNLLNNAIKFTPAKGKITINSEVLNGYIRISVTDTGIGISEEQQENLFKLEHSADASMTSEEKGTGLGLVLCKEFVEIMNGEISVESEPGVGSTFSFTLPLIKSQANDKK